MSFEGKEKEAALLPDLLLPFFPDYSGSSAMPAHPYPPSPTSPGQEADTWQCVR